MLPFHFATLTWLYVASDALSFLGYHFLFLYKCDVPTFLFVKCHIPVHFSKIYCVYLFMLSWHCFLTAIKWHRDHESTTVFCGHHWLPGHSCLALRTATWALAWCHPDCWTLSSLDPLTPWHTQGHTEFCADLGRWSLCSCMLEAVSGVKQKLPKVPPDRPYLVLSHNRTWVMSSRQSHVRRLIWVRHCFVVSSTTEEALVLGSPVGPGSVPRR